MPETFDDKYKSSDAILLSLYSEAKRGDWTSLIRRWIEDYCLLEQCANYSKPSSGWGFLHQAAYHGNEDACRLLIHTGASITKRSQDGESPLDVASRKGRDHLFNLFPRGYEIVVCDNALYASDQYLSSLRHGSAEPGGKLGNALRGVDLEKLNSFSLLAHLLDTIEAKSLVDNDFAELIRGRNPTELELLGSISIAMEAKVLRKGSLSQKTKDRAISIYPADFSARNGDALRATDCMRLITQVKGCFNANTGTYEPPPPFTCWSEVVEVRIRQHGCRLSRPASWYLRTPREKVSDPCGADQIRILNSRDSVRALPSHADIITVATCFAAESLGANHIIDRLEEAGFLYWGGYREWSQQFKLWRNTDERQALSQSNLAKAYISRASLEGICYYLTLQQRVDYWGVRIDSNVFEEFIEDGLQKNISYRLLELL